MNPNKKLTAHHRNFEDITSQVLTKQNQRFHGLGGVSRKNHAHGFKPAFCDMSTGNLYFSMYANGELAPIHLLDSLPEKLLAKCSESGKFRSTVETVVAGFVSEDQFFTREEAAMVIKKTSCGPPTSGKSITLPSAGDCTGRNSGLSTSSDKRIMNRD